VTHAPEHHCGRHLGASALLFAASPWSVRSRETVEASSGMRAMIPHLSIAILTSERAYFNDPQVRKVASRKPRDE